MKVNVILAATFIVLLNSCDNCSNNPDNRSYEESFNSSPSTTISAEDEPYLDNSLSTGTIPYECEDWDGDDSEITVRTSEASNCDVVVMLKNDETLIKNVYIVAGDSYTFHIPNGKYQVFFYGGRGWNPEKIMPNGAKGGFVCNESYSKDEAVFIQNEILEYDLIPQKNGNFRTIQSNANELF